MRSMLGGTVRINDAGGVDPAGVVIVVAIRLPHHAWYRYEAA
jgi:hypothetical protein